MGCGGSKRAAVADSSSVEAHSAHRRAPPAPAPTGKETGRSHGAQKKGAKGSAHDPQQAPAATGTAAPEDGYAPLSDSAVKVAVVVRPLLPNEQAKNAKTCCHISSDHSVVLSPRAAAAGPTVPDSERLAFQMERAYLLNSLLAERRLFGELVQPLLDRFLSGFNATVFAYGQTGAGKTYVMGTAATNDQIASPREENGVIPRGITYLFSKMAALRQDHLVTLKVEFVEIYQDDVRDLLRAGDTPRGPIVIRESPLRGPYCENIVTREVQSVAEVGRALEEGNALRATAAHNLNEASSRSHALFTLHMELRKRPDAAQGHKYLRCKLHLVDLAGSERAKETGTTGQAFAEGVTINKGLSALGNVISALTEGSGRKHIPYRDSKLTRLLQDSLGGNSETLMLACVGPAHFNREQTLNTLRYAARARNIRNKVRVNNKFNPEEEIQALRATILERDRTIASLQAELQAARQAAPKTARKA